MVAPFYGRPGEEDATECVRLLQCQMATPAAHKDGGGAAGGAESETTGGDWDVVGYSFGALLAGLVATDPATRARVRRLVLIAPAIDQGRRNAPVGTAGLVGYAADQALTRPAFGYAGRRTRVLVVHGQADSDRDGCDPALIAQWVAELNATAATGGEPPVDLLTPAVGHCMTAAAHGECSPGDATDGWLAAVGRFLGAE